MSLNEMTQNELRQRKEIQRTPIAVRKRSGISKSLRNLGQEGRNKTSEIRDPGSQMKKELQDGGSDYLCQKLKTVELDEDQLKVTDNLDSNSFREWWTPKPNVVNSSKNGG